MKVACSYLFLFLLSLCQLSRAQELTPDFLLEAGEEAIPLPESRVLDFGDVFSRDEGGFQELATQLDALFERYRYSVYFIAYSGIIGSDVQERAEDFRDQWLPDGVEGLVFVCDTDTRQFAFALTKGHRDGEEGAESRWILADHKVFDVMDEVLNRSSEYSGESEGNYLRAMGSCLAEELESRLLASSQTPEGASLYYLLVFALTGLAIFGLVLWARRNSRQEVLSQHLIEFPQIEIPSRLGAQYGGGLVSEISFKPPGKE